MKKIRGKWGESERKSEQLEQGWGGEGKMGNRRGAQRQRGTDGEALGEEAGVRVLSPGPQVIYLLPGRTSQGAPSSAAPG